VQTSQLLDVEDARGGDGARWHSAEGSMAALLYWRKGTTSETGPLVG
jgi:hypothetical protein